MGKSPHRFVASGYIMFSLWGIDHFWVVPMYISRSRGGFPTLFILFLCMFATMFTKIVELVGDPPSLEIVELWYFGMIILLLLLPHGISHA